MTAPGRVRWDGADAAHHRPHHPSLYPLKPSISWSACRLAGPGRLAGSSPPFPVSWSPGEDLHPGRSGRDGSPVGGCALSASIGTDGRRGRSGIAR